MNVCTDRESLAKVLWSFVSSEDKVFEMQFKNDCVIKSARWKRKFTFLKQDLRENTVKIYDKALFTSTTEPDGVNDILTKLEL